MKPILKSLPFMSEANMGTASGCGNCRKPQMGIGIALEVEGNAVARRKSYFSLVQDAIQKTARQNFSLADQDRTSENRLEECVGMTNL
ncbi:MAG: hypothetical protein ACLVAT_02755 [Lachnospiraceae bacterium]